mgnify:CR=1 FL=1
MAGSRDTQVANAMPLTAYAATTALRQCVTSTACPVRRFTAPPSGYASLTTAWAFISTFWPPETTVRSTRAVPASGPSRQSCRR